MAYNLIMERGLAYIASLCSPIGKQFWGSNYPRNAGKKLRWNFQHTMPTSSQWWRKALLSLCASPQEESCHFSMGLGLWGPWCSYALVNNIHSLKTSDFQNFLHSLELRMLDFFFPVFFLARCTSSFKNRLFTSLKHLLIGLLAILTFRFLSCIF